MHQESGKIAIILCLKVFNISFQQKIYQQACIFSYLALSQEGVSIKPSFVYSEKLSFFSQLINECSAIQSSFGGALIILYKKLNYLKGNCNQLFFYDLFRQQFQDFCYFHLTRLSLDVRPCIWKNTTLLVDQFRYLKKHLLKNFFEANAILKVGKNVFVYVVITAFI